MEANNIPEGSGCHQLPYHLPTSLRKRDLQKRMDQLVDLIRTLRLRSHYKPFFTILIFCSDWICHVCNCKSPLSSVVSNTIQFSLNSFKLFLNQFPTLKCIGGKKKITGSPECDHSQWPLIRYISNLGSHMKEAQV